MGNIVVLSFVYLVGIGLLLIFNELVYRRLNPTGEITRKFAHFVSVLATVPFPYIFPSHWYILVLALLFATILFITRNGKQLKSIHDVKRKINWKLSTSAFNLHHLFDFKSYGK